MLLLSYTHGSKIFTGDLELFVRNQLSDRQCGQCGSYRIAGISRGVKFSWMV